MKRRYWALQEFFLAYFHPDWQLDASSPTEVVEDFVTTSDDTFVGRVMADLRDIVVEPVSDVELHDSVLHEYSLFYDPSAHNQTMREWLRDLLQDLDNLAPEYR